MRDTTKCPVKIRNDKICDFVFPSTHYTDREPHLRTHTLSDVARSLFCLLGDFNWHQTMAKEAIENMRIIYQETKQE